MKIYPRIIHEDIKRSQNRSSVSEKGHFEAIFKRLLASRAPEESSEVSKDFPSLPPELIQKTESILEELEALLEEKDVDLYHLKVISSDVLKGLSQAPAGPGRTLLQEIALLGVVEAEKRLAS